MRCPQCGGSDTTVHDTRELPSGNIRRRRRCGTCSYRYTTEEIASVVVDGLRRAATERQARQSKVMSAIDKLRELL